MDGFSQNAHHFEDRRVRCHKILLGFGIGSKNQAHNQHSLLNYDKKLIHQLRMKSSFLTRILHMESIELNIKYTFNCFAN